MARRTPGLVQMKTSTTGNGPYTLTNPSPALAAKRTIADAVADSSLANGDQIIYCIKDTTALPTGKLMELGIGTINTTTLELTVVNVIERSAALTSGGGWGAGTRDVIISPPVASITAFTDFNNIFTVTQFIKAAFLEFHITPATNDWMRIERLAGEGYFAMSSEKTAKETLKIYNGWSGSGTAAGETLIDFFVGDYTSLIRALRIRESGALEVSSTIIDGSSRKAVFFPTGGTVKMTFNSAPPTGWTRINVTGERVAKYAGAADTPGDQGGSWTISGLTTEAGTSGNHTLTIAQMPSHDHETGMGVGSAQSGAGVSVIIAGGVLSTGFRGGDGSHSHSVPSVVVNSAGAWRPAYEICVKASFD